MRLDTRLLPAKVFYFFWFGALGALLPFLSLYYRAAGLDLTQIGILTALAGVVQLVAAPLWSVLADTFRLRRMLWPLAAAGTIGPILLIGRTSSFGVLFGLALLQAFFAAPVIALADSATLTLLGSRREQYGAQRVWGGGGWAFTTIITGRMIERWGYGAAFWGYAVCASGAVLATLALPQTQLVATNLAAAARTFLRDARWFSLLGCVFLIGCCGSIVHSFVSLFLQDIGASDVQIGLAHSIASLSELPVMALSPILLRRWGARPLMVTAGVLYAVRMAIYIFAPFPLWALAAQSLHGLCFGALWTAGVVEVQRLAPKGLEATAQSVFGLAVFGVASAAASLFGGRIYQEFGVLALFGIGAGTALAGSLGLVLFRPKSAGAGLMQRREDAL